MDLLFEVNNQILRRLDDKVIVNRSKNYLICDFTFLGSEWEDKDKFAIFKNDKGKAYELYLGTNNKCRCTVPHEALTGDLIRISVYGGDLITSSELSIVMLPAGYTVDIFPTDPSSKDVFVDVFEKLESKIDHVSFEDGFLKFFSDSVLLEQIPLFLEFREDIKELIPYFRLEENGDLVVVYPE